MDCGSELESLRSVAAVKVYCDGSFLPSRGSGGWAFRVVDGTRDGSAAVLLEACGTVNPARSARFMEVEAITQALRRLRGYCGDVLVVSDSLPLVGALVRRSQGGARGISGAARLEVLLLEHPGLRRELEGWRGRPLRWAWVRSHSGNEHHNGADRLARQAASGQPASERQRPQAGS